MADNVVAPPCNGWGITYIGCNDTTALDGLDPEEQQAVQQMAVDLLWILTGRRLGPYPSTVRPCLSGCRDDGSTWQGRSGAPAGHGLAGWMGYLPFSCGSCCSQPGACCCEDGTRQLVLPGPVCDIDSVTIDGDVLPPESYRLDGRTLYRTDGNTWPTCQNLSLPSTEPGTFQVTYFKGTPVPTGGKVAAGVLAVELARSLCNDGKCQLPTRVQTVTRQGVTMAVMDTFEGLENGKTGIWLIDSWVASMRRQTRRSRVYSPDLPVKR